MLLQEPAGEQHGALERAAAVAARAHRVGDQEGHGAHRPRARLRRHSRPPKAAGNARTNIHIHADRALCTRINKYARERGKR